MTDVEVFWPAGSPLAACEAALLPLQEVGVETTCHQMKVRRSADTAVMILVASTTVEPFLSAVFDRVGADAHSALRRFVGTLLGRAAPDPEEAADAGGRTDGGRAPRAVVFESSTTGAQFVFTDDLPAAAYQQAVTLDPQGGRGRWVWASGQEAWLPLEEAPA